MRVCKFGPFWKFDTNLDIPTGYTKFQERSRFVNHNLNI